MSKTNTAGCPASSFAKGSSARTSRANNAARGLKAKQARGEDFTAEELAAVKRYDVRTAAADAAYEAWKVERAAVEAGIKAKANDARAAEQIKQDAARKAVQDAAIAQYLADPASLSPGRAAWCKAELERRAAA